MNRILVTALSAGVAFFAGGGCRSMTASAPSPMAAGDAPAGSSALYTAYNLWFGSSRSGTTKKMSSVNHHVGTIIPAGSQVSNVSTLFKTIRFQLADGGRRFSIQFIPKFHPGVSIKEFTNRLFASQPLEERIKKFSDEEKLMIRRGAVGNGMSKEAVLVSWGYPPEHRTLSTKADTWLYWRNRFMKQAVDFDKNGKVINVR